MLGKAPVCDSLATLPTPGRPTVILQFCSLTHLLFCSPWAPFDCTKWCLWWAIDHGQMAWCFKKKTVFNVGEKGGMMDLFASWRSRWLRWAGLRDRMSGFTDSQWNSVCFLSSDWTLPRDTVPLSS